MVNHQSGALRRVSILATDGVFASTLMQAKDFFHMAGIRYARQQGLGDQPPFEILLVSPDGQVEAKPIKGTAPRHRDPVADAAHKQERAKAGLAAIQALFD